MAQGLRRCNWRGWTVLRSECASGGRVVECKWTQSPQAMFYVIHLVSQLNESRTESSQVLLRRTLFFGSQPSCPPILQRLPTWANSSTAPQSLSRPMPPRGSLLAWCSAQMHVPESSSECRSSINPTTSALSSVYRCVHSSETLRYRIVRGCCTRCPLSSPR